MADLDRVRWGILSTAKIGLHRFIPGAIGSNNGVVTAIAGRDKARAEQAAEKLGVPRAYGSYEELLADPEIDAIYNPLPNTMHAEWTLRAAQAGKPISAKSRSPAMPPRLSPWWKGVGSTAYC